MNINSKILFKDEYRDGYPLVNLKAEHFDIKENYKFSTAIFKRPERNEKVGTAHITLINQYGDLVEQELTIEFEFSEAERIIKALDPSSFKVRNSALASGNARKISVLDIVNEFEDVEVISVTPKKTKTKNLWKLNLVVKLSSMKSTFSVELYVDYNNLKDTSLTSEEIVREKSEIEKISPLDLVTFDSVEGLDVDPNLLKGSPPVEIDAEVITVADNVEISLLEYLPPKDIDSKEAAFKVEYTVKGERRKHSKIIGFEYNKSIRDAANETIANVHSTDFKYVIEDRTTIPSEITEDDFEYVGNLQNLDIIDVKYSFDNIGMTRRFITVELIIDFKTITYKIDKILEFAYSKEDYSTGTFREARQESESISIPQNFIDPFVLEKISNGNKKVKADMISKSTISKDYPYNKIQDIRLTRFFPDSKLVIFTVVALERRGKLKIKHEFEKTVKLQITLNEKLLEATKPEDIKIKQGALPSSPQADIDASVFIIPKFAKLLSIQYVKPERTSNKMSVQLRLASGSKVLFVKKELEFDLTEDEFVKRQRDIWTMDYLNRINPAEISINLDLTGKPVDEVSANDISGVPDGVGTDVKYIKPAPGTNNGRLIITLSKESSRVRFEQTIFFNENA